MTFDEWWEAYPKFPSDKDIEAENDAALSAWYAAIAECVRRLRDNYDYLAVQKLADWLEQEMKK